MQIKDLLNEQYQGLSDEKQRAIFMSEVISFLHDITMQKVDFISQLTLERENLQGKVNRAAELIEEAKNETIKVKKATIGETKKKLQIAKDRIIAIASTSNFLGTQINHSEDKSVMVDTLNNIIVSVGIVTEELSYAGLWDKDEDKPVITQVLVTNSPKKKTKKRKESNNENE